MRNDKSINVRISEELYNTIAADAKAQNISLNEIVRRTLQAKWNNLEQNLSDKSWNNLEQILTIILFHLWNKSLQKQMFHTWNKIPTTPIPSMNSTSFLWVRKIFVAKL